MQFCAYLRPGCIQPPIIHTGTNLVIIGPPWADEAASTSASAHDRAGPPVAAEMMGVGGLSAAPTLLNHRQHQQQSAVGSGIRYLPSGMHMSVSAPAAFGTRQQQWQHPQQWQQLQDRPLDRHARSGQIGPVPAGNHQLSTSTLAASASACRQEGGHHHSQPHQQQQYYYSEQQQYSQQYSEHRASGFAPEKSVTKEQQYYSQQQQRQYSQHRVSGLAQEKAATKEKQPEPKHHPHPPEPEPQQVLAINEPLSKDELLQKIGGMGGSSASGDSAHKHQSRPAVGGRAIGGIANGPGGVSSSNAHLLTTIGSSLSPIPRRKPTKSTMLTKSTSWMEAAVPYLQSDDEAIDDDWGDPMPSMNDTSTTANMSGGTTSNTSSANTSWANGSSSANTANTSLANTSSSANESDTSAILWANSSHQPSTTADLGSTVKTIHFSTSPHPNQDVQPKDGGNPPTTGQLKDPGAYDYNRHDDEGQDDEAAFEQNDDGQPTDDSIDLTEILDFFTDLYHSSDKKKVTTRDIYSSVAARYDMTVDKPVKKEIKARIMDLVKADKEDEEEEKEEGEEQDAFELDDDDAAVLDDSKDRDYNKDSSSSDSDDDEDDSDDDEDEYEQHEEDDKVGEDHDQDSSSSSSDDDEDEIDGVQSRTTPRGDRNSPAKKSKPSKPKPSGRKSADQAKMTSVAAAHHRDALNGPLPYVKAEASDQEAHNITYGSAGNVEARRKAMVGQPSAGSVRSARAAQADCTDEARPASSSASTATTRDDLSVSGGADEAKTKKKKKSKVYVPPHVNTDVAPTAALFTKTTVKVEMKKNQWSKARTFTPEELAAPLIAIWDATTSTDGFTKDHLEGLGVKYKLKSGNSAHEKMKKDSRNCISNTNRGLAESRGGIIYTLVQESFRPMKEKRKGNCPKSGCWSHPCGFYCN